ncbi:MAG: EF-hand domain-containing protein [Candidatus Poseidoniaceae archaeon]|nr:EF-hand domain-containing protein [Candidatus Poseidoniaceae archaeon]
MQRASMQGASSPLTDWINSDVEKAKIISIIMIIFAAWAGIEAISNVAGIEIPPETGMATNVDPDDTQRTNNGVIVGLGAVLGTVGIIIQMSIPRGTEEEEIVEESPKFDEDLVKLTKWLCSRGTTAAQFFDWADVDDSGTIDMVEFANALRQAEIANLPPWEIEELVKIMDINEDGRINLPELEIMLMKIQNTLGIDFVPYVEEETEDEEEPVEESEDDSTEEETEEETEESEDEVAEEETEESEDEVAEEEAEAEDGEEDAEEETAEDDAEEETEEETEAEDDSTEEETEDEPVVEEPPKKKKKF